MHSHTPHARAIIVGTLFLIGAFAVGFLVMNIVGKSAVFEDSSALERINVAGAPVTVFVADTAEKQVRGLSGVAELLPNHGMLFVFEKDDFYTIWMKDMQFAIDVLWMEESGTIIHIEESLTPSTYPRTFTSEKPARFILELPAGFVREHALSAGSIVTI